jgi:hypothetical protein
VVLDVETSELQTFGMSGEIEKVAAFCSGLSRLVRVAYEAGPTGNGYETATGSASISLSPRAGSRQPRRRETHGLEASPAMPQLVSCQPDQFPDGSCDALEGARRRRRCLRQGARRLVV